MSVGYLMGLEFAVPFRGAPSSPVAAVRRISAKQATDA
jgi:hypothetical protein